MDIELLFTAAECEKAILRIADGEKDALKVIYKHMHRQIYAVAYSVLRDFSSSDDVVQETYMRILEKAFSYRKGTNPRAWVLSIARNIAIDIVRRRRLEETAYGEESSEERFDERELVISMEVKKALDTLDDTERQIVTLKVYSGLRHAEIASLLGITAESSKKKYQRALQKLRTVL